MKINPTVTKLFFAVIAALILFILPGLKLPFLDKKTDAYFSDTMTKAGVAYGVCRVINASVSFIKESQIQIEPAGLGVSLAVGQILDPLDDMTERASDILITAIVSLGIQKIAYELSVALAPGLLGIALIGLACSLILKGGMATTVRGIALRLIILITVARLCLPMSSIISSHLDNYYFSPKITKAKDELTISSPEMERLKDMHMPKIDGILGTLKNSAVIVGEKASDLGAALKALMHNMENMISNLLKLSYLYIAQFLLQIIFLPVGIFWLLSRLINALFGTNIPNYLRHQELTPQIKTENNAQEAVWQTS